MWLGWVKVVEKPLDEKGRPSMAFGQITITRGLKYERGKIVQEALVVNFWWILALLAYSGFVADQARQGASLLDIGVSVIVWVVLVACMVAFIISWRIYWRKVRALIGVGLETCLSNIGEEHDYRQLTFLPANQQLKSVRRIMASEPLEPGWEEAYEGEARILAMALMEAGMIKVQRKLPAEGWYWGSLNNPTNWTLI